MYRTGIGGGKLRCFKDVNMNKEVIINHCHVLDLGIKSRKESHLHDRRFGQFNKVIIIIVLKPVKAYQKTKDTISMLCHF